MRQGRRSDATVPATTCGQRQPIQPRYRSLAFHADRMWIDVKERRRVPMRRFLFGVVIASVSAAMPSWAMGGDREIAEGIMTQLQQAKSQGMLKGFDLDLKVESGVVYLTGNVRSAAQHTLVVDAVERTTGVAQ